MVMIATAIHGSSPEQVQAIKVNMNADASHVAVDTKQPSGISGWASLWDWLQNGMHAEAKVDYTVMVPAQTKLREVNDVNGTIAIDGVTGDITASTVNGSAKIKDASHDLKLDTVNGKISAEMNVLDAGQSVSLNTVNGRIELAVPENASATFAVNTVNGGISSDFAALQPQKNFPVGRSLNAALGNGGGHVKADTVNGHVAITRRPPDHPTVAAPLPATNAPGGK